MKRDSRGSIPIGESLMLFNGELTFTPKKLPPLSSLNLSRNDIDPLFSNRSSSTIGPLMKSKQEIEPLIKSPDKVNYSSY